MKNLFRMKSKKSEKVLPLYEEDRFHCYFRAHYLHCEGHFRSLGTHLGVYGNPQGWVRLYPPASYDYYYDALDNDKSGRQVALSSSQQLPQQPRQLTPRPLPVTQKQLQPSADDGDYDAQECEGAWPWPRPTKQLILGKSSPHLFFFFPHQMALFGFCLLLYLLPNHKHHEFKNVWLCFLAL